MAKSYDEKIKFEREFFDDKIYDAELLIEKTTAALSYVLDDFNNRIRSTLGLGPWEYVASRINSVDNPTVLSIGSGPCGLELSIAKQLTGNYTFDCLDINEKLLSLGKEKALEEKLNISVLVQDANSLKLDKKYDFVIAHASLHHLINLEQLFQEVHDHLTERGAFFVFEATPRNGMLLWPETKALVDEIFKVLPEQFRYDHASEKDVVLRSEFPERDVSASGFECIRSQDIIPLLEKYFDASHRFHAYAFARRLVDSEFGKNWDLRRKFDKTILDLLLVLDHFLLSHGYLKTEGIFYVLNRKRGGPQDVV